MFFSGLNPAKAQAWQAAPRLWRRQVETPDRNELCGKDRREGLRWTSCPGARSRCFVAGSRTAGFRTDVYDPLVGREKNTAFESVNSTMRVVQPNTIAAVPPSGHRVPGEPSVLMRNHGKPAAVSAIFGRGHSSVPTVGVISTGSAGCASCRPSGGGSDIGACISCSAGRAGKSIGRSSIASIARNGWPCLYGRTKAGSECPACPQGCPKPAVI